MVFLKFQLYVQSSVANCACHKLAYKFYAYRMLKYVNEVAYELELPPGSQIQPVFQVSQLRRALLPVTTASSTLPSLPDAPAVPAVILQRRWCKRCGAMVEQVLVRWSYNAVVADT